MQLQFDSSQEYQIEAIEPVADLFEGQPRVDGTLEFALGTGVSFAAIPNRLELSASALLANLQAVQKRQQLQQDASLQTISETIELPVGFENISFPNYSVEMETGTGKTYVYIRTALELNRRYGMRKFIVVVLSVAIREGVLKTLQITQDHLRQIYDNIPYRFKTYDSSNLSQIRQFAISGNVEIMVMTIDSFNKASNVIRQTTDRLQGETPLHLVQATRPILILDEPQDMESQLRVAALASLNPLFALRYSATHRNPYNVVYRLTPYEAYRQNLVKKIEVAGIEKSGDENRPFMRLESVQTAKKTLTARITLHKLMATGQIKEQIVTVKPGDNLEPKANRPEYSAFTIEELDAGEGVVAFTNGTQLRVGETTGADKTDVFKAQIAYTIEQHFLRQRKLKSYGLKVLSLFFIDRVDNYIHQDSLIRRLFNESFNEIKLRYEEWNQVDPEIVQASYFASRKTKAGVVYEDTKGGESDKDKDAYKLIMSEKERLLSFEEPTSFIFSHSALGKGWDNPNVFQICTLNQTGSEMKKRQEIGRGVRLPVNQEGSRCKDPQLNILLVVANESYERYVGSYQEELQADYGREGLAPKPANARKRKKVSLRKKYLLKPEFKELWQRIAQKTRYAVKIDTEKLISEVVNDLDSAEIRRPELNMRRARIVAKTDRFDTVLTTVSKTTTAADTEKLPNLLEVIGNLLERTSPPMRLTRRTILEIISRSSRQVDAIENPHEFANVTAQCIKQHLADQLVDGIKYEKLNEWYEQCQFKFEYESWADNLVPTDRSLYNYAEVDSLADDPTTSIEGRFVLGLEKDDSVKLYFKLPDWFKVDTPIGAYNPDWAIVKEQRDAFGTPTGEQWLYLVRETKGTTDLAQLRLDERRKIHCGKEHFTNALGVDYAVVTDASQI